VDNRNLINEITEQIIKNLQEKRLETRTLSPKPQASSLKPQATRIFIPVGISNHHLHLDKETLSKLFGDGYELTVRNPLSQPGQFAANETVTVIGPKLRALQNVRILGPVRKQTQVEISKTDGIQIGIVPPVVASGNLEGTPGVILVGPKGAVNLPYGLIRANRHIHISKDDAEKYGIKDEQIVKVKCSGEKATILEKCQVRVSENFVTELHLDTDDGNATDLVCGDEVEIIL
jgi:putative phosphotransacetylase